MLKDRAVLAKVVVQNGWWVQTGRMFRRLQAPIDHPADGFAYSCFQRVAQLKKRTDYFDHQIRRWTHEREFLENLREVKGGVFESQVDEINGVIPSLTEQIELAEINRAESLDRADLAFREFAEVEIRLLDATYDALRLNSLLTDPQVSKRVSSPTLLPQLSTIVSLNNHRTDLFIQLARGLGFDEKLGSRNENCDNSLLAEIELDIFG